MSLLDSWSHTGCVSGGKVQCLTHPTTLAIPGSFSSCSLYYCGWEGLLQEVTLQPYLQYEIWSAGPLTRLLCLCVRDESGINVLIKLLSVFCKMTTFCVPSIFIWVLSGWNHQHLKRNQATIFSYISSNMEKDLFIPSQTLPTCSNGEVSIFSRLTW